MRILFCILFVPLLSNRSNSENRSYVLISFSNCTFCNNSLRIIQDDDKYIASSVLLGNAEDANIHQLKSLAEENFQIKFNGYKIDSKLFDRISQGINFKMPCFAIVNSKNEVLFKTTIDSFSIYKSIIRQYLAPKGKVTKLKPLNYKRLSEIGGYSSIQVFNNFIGITYFNKSDRIYFLDTRTKTIDSFHFANDDILLGKLFNMSGEKICEPKGAINFSKAYKLPYDLHHFGTLSLNGDIISTTDHLLYVNPKDTFEIITPNWKQFIFSVEINRKIIEFYFIDQWNDSMIKPNPFKEYEFNDQVYYKESDSTWLISAKKLTPDKLIDLNLYMIRFKNNKDYKLSPVSIDSFPRIPFYDFNGKSLNKPNFIIPFEYSKELLYFNESPYVLVKKEWVNMQKFLPSLNWIYDIEVNSNGNLLTLIIRELNNKRSIIYFDLISKSVINKIKLPHFESKSNVILTNNSVIFLDFSGRLCRYSIVQ